MKFAKDSSRKCDLSYHAMNNSNIFGVTWQPWIHTFTESSDHFKRWHMVIIKGVCFHTSIEVSWIITFFYTEIIDLKILEVIWL